MKGVVVTKHRTVVITGIISFVIHAHFVQTSIQLIFMNFKVGVRRLRVGGLEDGYTALTDNPMLSTTFLLLRLSADSLLLFLLLLRVVVYDFFFYFDTNSSSLLHLVIDGFLLVLFL